MAEHPINTQGIPINTRTIDPNDLNRTKDVLLGGDPDGFLYTVDLNGTPGRVYPQTVTLTNNKPGVIIYPDGSSGSSYVIVAHSADDLTKIELRTNVLNNTGDVTVTLTASAKDQNSTTCYCMSHNIKVCELTTARKTVPNDPNPQPVVCDCPNIRNPRGDSAEIKGLIQETFAATLDSLQAMKKAEEGIEFFKEGVNNIEFHLNIHNVGEVSIKVSGK